jgi:RNA recognition motif-containing protein
MAKQDMTKQETTKHRMTKQGMANTVRVSNMSELTTEDQVRALFNEAGQVKSIEMVTNNNGDSVGAAFVQLRNQVEVDKAIQLLHGKQYDNHTLEVTPA